MVSMDCSWAWPPGWWPEHRHPMLIDSHCHLDAAEFDADRAEVLARALAAVCAQVVPAVQVPRLAIAA